MKPMAVIFALVAAIISLSAPTATARKAYEIPPNLNQISTNCCDFYYRGEFGDAVQELADIADKNWEYIGTMIPIKPEIRPRIVVTRTPKDFQEAQPYGGISEWAAGVTYPRDRLVILRLLNVGPNPDLNVKQTFIHELSHVALYSVADVRVFPRWFSEGLAQYQAGQWSMDDFTTIARAAAMGSLLPFARIDRGWPSDAATARLAYAQSARFISHLNGAYGPEMLKSLIAETAETNNFHTAVKNVLGLSVPELERDFKNELKWYYVLIPLITGSSFLWFMMAVLVIVGYIRYRVRRREKLDAMAEEEGYRVSAPVPVAPKAEDKRVWLAYDQDDYIFDDRYDDDYDDDDEYYDDDYLEDEDEDYEEEDEETLEEDDDDRNTPPKGKYFVH